MILPGTLWRLYSIKCIERKFNHGIIGIKTKGNWRHCNDVNKSGIASRLHCPTPIYFIHTEFNVVYVAVHADSETNFKFPPSPHDLETFL